MGRRRLLDFLDDLLDLVGPVPLLVVCTARPELLERRADWGGGKRNAVTVSLTPLSEQSRGSSHLAEPGRAQRLIPPRPGAAARHVRREPAVPGGVRAHAARPGRPG